MGAASLSRRPGIKHAPRGERRAAFPGGSRAEAAAGAPIEANEGGRMNECECEVAQSCPILCDLMDYRAPPSMEILQEARILGWVAMPSSRESSRPRDRTQVSRIVGRHFTI